MGCKRVDRSEDSSRWGWLRPRLALALLLLAGAASANDINSSEVVVVVAAASPLESLSQAALSDVFLGRTSRLPDGRPAVALDLREGSSARAEFYETYLGRSAAQIKAHWSKIIFTGRGSPPREVANGLEMRRLVAQDPGAIGYLELSLVDDSVKKVRIE
ncbi:MAG TPA: phosphate ABC transporter substrate-binding protein [Thermoanaerobaculia bacterium]|nr:phosphate ABC transporter substrate-binding protein [Thermoanaerobaculia bacterium]